MNSSNPTAETHQVVGVNWADRWQVYQRLQELEIPCQCLANQPLQVQLQNPTAAIQLWSAVRQLTAPRHELVRWLARCWRLEVDREQN